MIPRNDHNHYRPPCWQETGDCPRAMRLLREPTAIDIPSGTADGVCVRRAEEDNEICDLLWGDKLEGGLFFDKKFHSSIGRGNAPFRNPIIDLFLD